MMFVLALASCGGGGTDSAPGQAAPSALSYASPQKYTVGTAIASLSPTVTGTVTSYSTAPSLPSGLSINSQTGEITGTPTAATAAVTIVITAANGAGSTSFDLMISVSAAASQASFSYTSPQTFTVGQAITPLTPTINGGTVSTFSVQPALPSGLSLDSTSGEISGIPTTATTTAVYAITGQTTSGPLTFDLSITVAIPPPSALFYSSPQSYIVGTPIAALTPTVTGAVVAYSVIPALPAGLSFNTATGLITGTPTSATNSATYSVTAMNASGSVSFNLTIAVLIPAPTALSYPSPQTYTTGQAIAPLNPTVTGTVNSYSVSPSLPAGLVLNAGTGQISGTPTTAQPATGYVISGNNSTGSTSFTLSIKLVVPPPSALSYRSPQTFYVGTAIRAIAPSVTGPVASYGVSPALPSGLTLNTTTGQISGTPTAAYATASYTVTASNASGSTSFALSITVLLLPPQSLSYPNPQIFAVSSAIVPLNPFVVGIVASYAVSPALPGGLTLNPSTGQITGTPLTLTPAATYTITASNASGSTTFALTITVATVGVTPAQISRLVAAGTAVVIQLAIQSESLTGTLYVTASDPSSLFNPAVSVTSTGNGYAAVLTVSTTIAAGAYSGNVLLTLCHDAACTMPQTPASISVPFNVRVLSPTSAWPGNNTTPLAAWSDVQDWTMFQGNAAHTGYVPVTIDPNSFSTRWQGGPTLNNTPNNYNGAFAYTLTTDGGQLYIATGSDLYALKELDASQVWSYGTPSVNPPAEANGTVYMAAGEQASTYLFAFDETDGSLVFQSQMSSQFEHYFAPTIGANGVYTNSGTYGGLYGFDFSGNELFFDTLAQTSHWTPAVDGNSVYSYTGPLTLANPVTGAVTAMINDTTFQNFEYVIDGSPVLGAPGSVIAANYANAYINGGSEGNFLLDFNVNSQAITWQQPGDYGYNPAYNAGVVYAANNSPLQLEARNESDGSLLWSWVPPQAGDNTFNSEVLLTDSLIFVSTNLATYGIDFTTHRLVFSYPFPGRLALSHNGILYIQGTGPIVAINVK
jgi:hypothetical protein